MQEFDAGQVLNQPGAGMGKQEIKGTFFISPDVNAEQKLEIKTKTSIPIALGQAMQDYVIMTTLTFID
jgi:hypothetical protein